MSTSAFGIDHGDFSKARDRKGGAKTGAMAGGAAGGAATAGGAYAISRTLDEVVSGKKRMGSRAWHLKGLASPKGPWPVYAAGAATGAALGAGAGAAIGRKKRA